MRPALDNRSSGVPIYCLHQRQFPGGSHGIPGSPLDSSHLVTAPLSEPVDLWEAELWDELLANLDERRVIPIVGPDLLVVDTPRGTMPLESFLAAELADRVGLTDLRAPRNLNEVVCAHLRRGQRREALYPRLKTIFQETELTPPAALRKLAEIAHFDLFVTTTFDPLLELALNTVRFGGEERTETVAYSTREARDLAVPKRDLRAPLVYHLFGRLSASPSYVLSEEDLLEFIFALQSPARAPERLFDELERNHLLLLGGNFADWFARMFLRTAKGHRLSESREVLEILADSRTPSEPGLVTFLAHFSSRTRVFQGSAVQFVDELHRRYRELHPAAETGPGLAYHDEMRPGSVFLSYASEDRRAVERLKAGLEASGIPVWFDRDQLKAGDHWRDLLRHNIDQCSLFIPVLSATTERKIEGEFRREWRWALDREQRMAGGRVFILPVVVDETDAFTTAERRFLELHIAQLPGGEVSTEFRDRIRRILERIGAAPGGNAT